MGGLTFDTDLAKDDEIAHINMGGKGSWLKAIHAAGAEDILNLAQCRDDLDGECASRGCLNPHGMRARKLPISDFLSMHQRVLSIIQSDPQQFPDGAVEAEKTLNFFRGLIKCIESAIGKGAKETIIFDDLRCPDIYPCPRIWSTPRAPSDDELREEPRLTRVIMQESLDYDEAVEKLQSGEWEANFREVYGFRGELPQTKER